MQRLTLRERSGPYLGAPKAGELTQPCISRDGKKLAAMGQADQANHGLCVIDRPGGGVKWLLKQRDFDVRNIQLWPESWSPDGTAILVQTANAVGQDRRIVVYDSASGASRRLVEGQGPAWSPEGKRVVFEGGVGDKGDLYVIAPDGKDLQRISNATPPGAQMIWGSHPCWSPDGKQVVFRRGPYVWVANSDGTGQVSVAPSADRSRLTNTGARVGPFEWTPRWKPDGGLIFSPYKEDKWEKFGTVPEYELILARVDGTDPHRLLMVQGPADGDDACWSSDGSKMVFDKNGNIWSAKGDGSDPKRLTGGRNGRWSPDGERILYVRGSENNEVLCVINADGSNQIQITEASHGYRGYCYLVPDGKKVVFEGNNGVWGVSGGGGDARRIVPGVHQPCWSPDGKKIAVFAQGKPVELQAAEFASSVYVMNADGSGIRPVMQVDKNAYGENVVSNLSWSADNKHILFEETAKAGNEYGDAHEDLDR